MQFHFIITKGPCQGYMNCKSMNYPKILYFFH